MCVCVRACVDDCERINSDGERTTRPWLAVVRRPFAVCVCCVRQVRDEYSNKRLEGGDAVEASLTSNTTTGVIAATCTHTNDGLYDCTYTAQAAGPQTLFVTVEGIAIVSSPFSVEVGSRAPHTRTHTHTHTPTHCTMHGALASVMVVVVVAGRMV